MPLSPVSKVCVIFSNRKTPPTFERQSWATEIAYTAHSGSWTPLTNNSKGGFPFLVLSFCYITYDPWVKYHHPKYYNFI